MTANPLAVLEAAYREATRPDPLRSIPEWADECRYLDSSASPEPGLWRTDRVPYLREIMECLSPHSEVQICALMCSAQIAKTEAGINMIMHSIDDSPGPCMIVQPREIDAENFTKIRLKRSFNASPTVREKVRSGDDDPTLTLFTFPGGVLKLVGAQSAAGLRSMPVRRVFFDELDGAPDNVEGEGDPVELVMARTQNFPNRKVYICSTPTYHGASKIQREYELGDQRLYHVPCPLCGSFQLLQWERVRYERENPAGAWLQCEHCDGRIENHHKTWMLARGEWRPTNPDRTDKLRRSYHISALYAPHGWISWGDIANKVQKSKGDPNKERSVANLVFGIPYKPETGAGLSADDLAGGATDWGANVPGKVCLLTAGVDTQDDRLAVEIVGWGIGEESWSLAYLEIEGDPELPNVWAELDRVLDADYRRDDGVILNVAMTCVDSAGHRTAAVYDYTKRRRDRPRLAIVGRSNPDSMFRPIFAAKARRSQRGRAKFYVVGTDTAKEQIYGRLGFSKGQPGYCHFPKGRPKSYFEGLVCERFELTRRGRKAWKKPDGARNEPLDCRVYACAARDAWYSIGGNTLEREVDACRKRSQSVKRLPEPAQAPPAQAAPAPRADDSWIGGGANWLDAFGGGWHGRER